MATAGAAAFVAMAVILGTTLMGGSSSAGEIFLETASAPGSDPFTPSTAKDTKSPAPRHATPSTSPASGTPTSGANGTNPLQVNGSHPGLYGGTQNVATCDIEKQIAFLTQNKDKGRAFAGALGIRQADIPAYLRSLTPARLGWDTRVTNHGYKNNAATSFQSILQAGTAVLVNDRGVPRVRCTCGNPLTPPVAVQGQQKYKGQQWSSFQPSSLVAVQPADQPMKTVRMFDEDSKAWFERPSGDVQDRHDQPVPPPKGPGSSVPTPTLPTPIPGQVEEPPQENEDVKPPEENEEVKPPEENEDVKPPEKDEEVKPPEKDEDVKPPEKDEEVKPPEKDEEVKPPEKDEEVKPPEKDHKEDEDKQSDESESPAAPEPPV
ncbi:DUF6777 domain-containing protein, partial [Streptomyces sp. NPDC054841]